MKTIIVRLLATCMLLMSSALALAVDPIESRPVHFSQGSTSTTIKDTIKGDKTIDYTVRASAGQAMTVSLKTSNASNYFNVLPPGSNDEAIFIGSTEGNRWQGILAADGEYRIRVYLMRSAARRNEAAKYSLTVGVAGPG